MNIDILSLALGFSLGLVTTLICRRRRNAAQNTAAPAASQKKDTLACCAEILPANSQTPLSFGFNDIGGTVCLYVPLKLTFSSSFKQIPRTLRDIQLVLFRDGEPVKELLPEDPAARSASIAAGQSTNLQCIFRLNAPANTGSLEFDQIFLRYWDESNEMHLHHLCDEEGSWQARSFTYSGGSAPMKEHGKDGCLKKFTVSDAKTAHLQLLQEPISRMSTTSAIFKGFAATIVAGISALTYKDIHISVLGLSFLPVLAFTLLDLYYLRLEREFRYSYNRVRLDLKPIDFAVGLSRPPKNMDKRLAKLYWKNAKARLRDLITSPSIWLFYPAMIAILAVVFVLHLKGKL